MDRHSQAASQAGMPARRHAGTQAGRHADMWTVLSGSLSQIDILNEFVRHCLLPRVLVMQATLAGGERPRHRQHHVTPTKTIHETKRNDRAGSRLRKTHLPLSASLCLSRACLGKMVI
jgi:hypothetical protein